MKPLVDSWNTLLSLASSSLSFQEKTFVYDSVTSSFWFPLLELTFSPIVFDWISKQFVCNRQNSPFRTCCKVVPLLTSLLIVWGAFPNKPAISRLDIFSSLHRSIKRRLSIGKCFPFGVVLASLSLSLCLWWTTSIASYTLNQMKSSAYPHMVKHLILD